LAGCRPFDDIFKSGARITDPQRLQQLMSI
jgi:hypothetical protein